MFPGSILRHNWGMKNGILRIPRFPQLFLTLLVGLVLAVSTSAQMGPDTGPDLTLDAATRSETIKRLAQGLREVYVFPEVGEKAAKMLETRLAAKEYDAITSGREFGELLTKQILEIAHDKHLRVRFSSTPFSKQAGGPPNAEQQAAQTLQLKKRNYDFERVERLPGNLGYLKLNAFMDPAGAGPILAGAMAFLNNTDALIIDLRQNGGGRPDMVALLASYFFKAEPRLHLNTIAHRKEGTTEYENRESWTVTKLAGDRYLDKPVYVLTSPRSFSGAEEFAYDLQTQKRATLVGETTGGGANPGGPYRLSDHYVAFMPDGHAINPITKTNWEGVGVVPDVKVPQEDALKTAQALALKQLIAKTTDPRELNGLKQALAQVEGGSTPAADTVSMAPTAGGGPATSVTGLAGMWSGQITDPRGSAHTMTIDLKIEGAKISGTITGGPPAGAPETIIGGTISGDQISLEVNSVDPEGNTMKTTYAGKLAGNTITGALSSRMGSMPFTVTRK